MIGRRLARGGRPGLIGTAARTAVIAGTATAVSNRVAGRQMEHQARQQAAAQEQAAAAQQTAQPAQPAAKPDLDDEAVGQLERLGSLFSQGLLTAEEFAAAKQRVLTG
ncbi:SHOCT domain-containing protein [Actinospica robiniae]|uniref:SHOCT domain-containing protein n=1 Tax=Actinospica robiniae TaxID=304901 RepID=UPI0004063A6A|nr:SHOCT domain-containing protein [Actinospica robiniae]